MAMQRAARTVTRFCFANRPLACPSSDRRRWAARIRYAITFAGLLALAGCDRVPDIDAAAAESILIDARVVLSSAPLGPVARSAWPESFARISPTSVRVTEQGLYIVTYSFFVEESGFFVARDLAEFDWEKRIDPAFVPVRGELFEYHATG